MPEKVRWPEPEALVEAAGSAVSVTDLSRRLGVHRRSLTDYLDREGLRERVDAALGSTPPSPEGSGEDTPPSLDERPIDDPARLREDQREAERKHLRRENRQLRERFANREAVVERIVEAARVPVRVPEYRVAEQDPELPARSCIAPLYDLQYGQLVRPSDTPLDVGEFDSTIFDERAARYVEAVTGSLRDYAASHQLEELVFALGGDFVEGADIFAGQAWQLEKDPARQTVDLASRMEQMLRELIRFAKEEVGVERIGIYAVPGNHGKVGGKRSGATPATMSWDWLFAMMLRDKLRGEPVDQFVIEPAGVLLFETAGHVFLTIHGDEVKGWGGLPFYGLAKYDGKAIRLARLVYDYCLLGHHHQPASIPNGSGGEFIVSGDWVGGNNLSKFLAAASRPQQRILFVSRKFGITENVPIYFTESSARSRPHVYSMEAPDGAR